MGLSQDKPPFSTGAGFRNHPQYQGFLPVSTCPFAPWTVPFKSWLILPIDAASNRFCSGQRSNPHVFVGFHPRTNLVGQNQCVFAGFVAEIDRKPLPNNVLHQDDSEQDHDFPVAKKTWTHPNQCQAEIQQEKHPNGHHAHCLMLSNQ